MDNIKTLNANENRQSKTDPVGEEKGQPFTQFRLMNKFCMGGKKCIGSSVSKMLFGSLLNGIKMVSNQNKSKKNYSTLLLIF